MTLLRIISGVYGLLKCASTETIASTANARPGQDFFTRLSSVFPDLPIIAEDLGTITQDVWAAMEHFGFPGMKVLLFAFDESLPRNAYAPHNHTKNSVVYTGTHDNNTARAWFEKEADDKAKERLSRYIGREIRRMCTGN
jgi:4-alpha-glucanotransferase